MYFSWILLNRDSQKFLADEESDRIKTLMKGQKLDTYTGFMLRGFLSGAFNAVEVIRKIH